MLNPGDRIENWEVLNHLGSGGMGSVYRCRHVMVDGIEAAVKILKAGGGFGDRERFMREIKAVYHLRHPAIVRVTGFGEDTVRELVWMAMELVEGHTLEKQISAGPTRPGDALRLFQPLADGLAHAHEKGIFHRDLKPANIVVGEHNQAVLVDFGIAGMDGGTRLTATGMVAGTPGYMAPEVFGGEEVLPHATDVYALGQVFHEVLVGTRAFPEPDGMSDGQRLMHLIGSKTKREALDPGPQFSSELRQLIWEATALEPSARIPSMVAFAERLRHIPQVDSAQGAVPASIPPTTRPVALPTPPSSQHPHRTSSSHIDNSPSALPHVKKRQGKGGLFVLGGLGLVLLLGVIGFVVVVGGVVVYQYSGQTSSMEAANTAVIDNENAAIESEPVNADAPNTEVLQTQSVHTPASNATPDTPTPSKQASKRSKPTLKPPSVTPKAPDVQPVTPVVANPSPPQPKTSAPAPEPTPEPSAVAQPEPTQPSLTPLQRDVQQRRQRLLGIASTEWARIEGRMKTTDPKYLVGSVKAYISRHERLIIRIGDYEEIVKVPEVTKAKAWLEANT